MFWTAPSMINCSRPARRTTCKALFQVQGAVLTIFRLYRDQLFLTERHLDGLISDANSTLSILSTLSNSFKSVESQTSSFQSQCEDLLREQQRLEKLANNVGTDLYYYAYIDTATRRLNAPGASRMVDGAEFGEMVENIEACIVFMLEHVSRIGNVAKLANRSRNPIATVKRTLPATTRC